MIGITKKHLILISAIFWYSGSISLGLKSVALLKNAFLMYSNLLIVILAALGGIVIGYFKGKYIFARSCRKNIQRINNLQKIRLWLFFKPSFMIALALMIAAGASLSRLAEGNYHALLAVGALDLTIGTALFYSSFVYWENKFALW